MPNKKTTPQFIISKMEMFKNIERVMGYSSLYPKQEFEVPQTIETKNILGEYLKDKLSNKTSKK